MPRSRINSASQSGDDFPPCVVSWTDLRRMLTRRRTSLLSSLVDALWLRDRQTWEHCQRVQEYARLLADAVYAEEEDRRLVGIAGLLHDIGKVALPDGLLCKQDRLSDDEFNAVRQHTLVGERLVRPLLDDPTVLGGVRSHHERIDGTGYPDRLIGPNIPLAGRIIAVADTFDALTSTRPYRTRKLGFAEALLLLQENTAGQLDQELVGQFVTAMRRARKLQLDGRRVAIDIDIAGLSAD